MSRMAEPLIATQPALWPPAASVRHNRFTSSNIDEIRAYTSLMFNPLNVTTPPGLTGVSFSHAHATLDRLSFNFMDYGHSDGYIEVSIPPLADCFYFQFSLAGTCEFQDETGTHEMDPGSAFMVQPDRPCLLRLNPGYKSLFIRGEQSTLERIVARRLGRTLKHPLRFAPSPASSRHVMETLAGLVSLICRDLNSDQPNLTSRGLCGHTEEMLLLLIVQSMEHNYSSDLREMPARRCPAYVRRAESFINTHALEPVTLEDIVRHAGTSERALHAGFRKYRGTSPLALLKASRLDISRELLLSDTDQASVTEVALNCGFTHLSRFAADYKRRFGEAPSATRRKPPARRRLGP